MKILLISPVHDYAYRERGYSWDYMNLESGLRDAANKFDWRVCSFHPDKYENLKQAWWDILYDQTLYGGSWAPDIVIENYFQQHLEIPPQILEYLKRSGSTICRWDSDSHKRFAEILASRDRYDAFITADPRMVQHYELHGLKVIPSMFAAGPKYYDRRLERDIDVSFIGQPYGIREQVVRMLRDAGVKIRVFGRGWNNVWGHKENQELIDEEYLTYPKMIEVLNRSKISLNFADVNHGNLPTAFYNNVKGRHFEIPACGACQISTPCDILGDYFEIGKEVIVTDTFTSVNNDGMIDWIRELLNNNELRQQIANAGRDRVNLHHRWEHRFGDIIKRIKEFRE